MAILKKIVLALVVLIVLLAAIGMMLPRNVHVERSIVIDAPPATVFALVDGYKQFNKWSPWAALDPNAKYTIGRAGVRRRRQAVLVRRSEDRGNRQPGDHRGQAERKRQVEARVRRSGARHRELHADARNRRHEGRVGARLRHGQGTRRPLLRADDGLDGRQGLREGIGRA